MKETFGNVPPLEWQEAISAAGGASTVCKTVEEWLDHPHPLDAKMVVDVEDAVLGHMRQPRRSSSAARHPRGHPGTGLRCSASTPMKFCRHWMPSRLTQGQRTRSPAKGQNEKILSALQGVRVLDLGIVLAGPTWGRTLAEYGAEVIKIDDPSRPYDPSGSLDVNRGKRSMFRDLKRGEGRQVFFELLETADVVVENYRKGSLAKLGLDYDSLRQRKPDLVYASLKRVRL